METKIFSLADELVENGKPVSYSSIQEALREKYGRGASYRDIQGPLALWKKRRRYKPHLALLDLPEEMEKPLADFVTAAKRIAQARAKAEFPVSNGQGPTASLLEQMQRIVTGLERQLAALADENRMLREQVAALLPPLPAAAVPETVRSAEATTKNFARKTGAALVAATAFWDRIVDDLAGRILLVGRPMSANELLLEIPHRTRDFASLAFQKLNKKALAHKLDQRIEGEKYGLFRTADGMYCVIPLSPDYRQDANAKDAALATLSVGGRW